jgi:cytochrome c-type biogenesis protein CcmF
MINTFVGNLGHLMTIVAFVSALVSAFAYIQYFQANEIDKASWRRFSRISFYIHAVITDTNISTPIPTVPKLFLFTT